MSCNIHLTNAAPAGIMRIMKLQIATAERRERAISVVKLGVTIDEAAEISGIGRNTMRKLVEWDKLPVLKVGRKTIIRTDTLERFMSVNQGRNLRCQNDVRRVD